jgi:hypothetical protein
MATKTNRSKLVIEGENTSAVNAIKGVSRQLGNAERDFKNFGSGVSGALSSVTGALTNLPLMIAGAATAATSGLALFVSRGVKSAEEFEAGMKNVNTVLGVTESELNVLGDGLLKVKQNLGVVETKELTDGLYQAASAGIAAADSIEFMDTATRAAKAGLSTISVSVDGLTTVLNAFHLETDQANEVADIMFETVRLGKTTFDELASNLAQVAPLAASTGVEFDQVAAAVASLTKQGVPTAQAITQIRAALLSANEILGDGWAQSMSLQDAFGEIAKQADGSQVKLREMIGRVEGMNAVLGLTGDNAKTAAQDLLAISNASGAMGTAFATQSDSLQFKSDKLKASIEVLSTSIGTALIPTLADAAEWAGNFFQELNETALETTIRQLSELDVAPDQLDRLRLLNTYLSSIQNIQEIETEIKFIPNLGAVTTFTSDEDFKEFFISQDSFDQFKENLQTVVDESKPFEERLNLLKEAQKDIASEATEIAEILAANPNLDNKDDLQEEVTILGNMSKRYFEAEVAITKYAAAKDALKKSQENLIEGNKEEIESFGIDDMYAEAEAEMDSFFASSDTYFNEFFDDQITAQLNMQKLAEEWTKTEAALARDIAKSSMSDLAFKFYEIDQKATELFNKYGDKNLIQTWLDTQKLALSDLGGVEAKDIQVNDIPDQEFGVTADVPEELVPTQTVGVDIQGNGVEELYPVDQLYEWRDMQLAVNAEISEGEAAYLALRQGHMEDTFNNMGNALLTFANMGDKTNKSLFAAYKAVSIAEAGVATYNAATKALAEVPFPFNFAAAAAVTAAGVANIARIASMQPGNGGAGGGSYSAPSAPPRQIDPIRESSTTNNQTQVTINLYGHVLGDMDALAREFVQPLEKALGDGAGNGVITINQ